MTEQERKELCKKCSHCDEEYLQKNTEGCFMWHNDRYCGGCSEYQPKNLNNRKGIMTGRDLANKLNYLGIEKNIRKLALDEKLATPENLAVMSIIEVCELVLEQYECVFSEDENIGLVRKDMMPEYKALIKIISK